MAAALCHSVYMHHHCARRGNETQVGTGGRLKRHIVDNRRCNCLLAACCTKGCEWTCVSSNQAQFLA